MTMPQRGIHLLPAWILRKKIHGAWRLAIQIRVVSYCPSSKGKARAYELGQLLCFMYHATNVSLRQHLAVRGVV